MKITPDLLQRALGCSAQLAERFAAPLEDACLVHGINTTARLAAFLAQIGHESGSLRYTREVWGPTPAQQRYEGRADLGNVRPGDGERYCGRGLIQTTGRYNYRELTRRLRERGVGCPDFEAEPERLEEPGWAALSAADYWDSRSLNALADSGTSEDFERMTRRINGGLNGQADRLARWERAKQALVAPPTQVQEAAPMLPFVAAALPALIQAAPALIRVFGDSPQAEKNAKAAEMVAEVAKQATGQPTVEGAVQAIASDPAHAAAYREAVHASLGELMSAMMTAHQADEASRDAAADRALRLGQATGGRWLWLVGTVAAVIVLASYGIVTLVLLRDGFSDETRALLLGQVVILGFGTVVSFLFGSNLSNRVDQAQRGGAK